VIVINRIRIEEGGKRWELIGRRKKRKRRIRAIEGKSVAGIKKRITEGFRKVQREEVRAEKEERISVGKVGKTRQEDK